MMNHGDTAAKRAGESLARARKAYGLTQTDLAQRTGIQQGAISRIERGLANPTLETLETLAAGIGVELFLDVRPRRTQSFTLTHPHATTSHRRGHRRPTR